MTHKLHLDTVMCQIAIRQERHSPHIIPRAAAQLTEHVRALLKRNDFHAE